MLVILLLYISTFTNLRNYIIFVNKPLALKIKRARKESKMSQRELGEALGVSDKDLENLLEIVDPAKLITKTWSWDSEKDWFSALSGGQKRNFFL